MIEEQVARERILQAVPEAVGEILPIAACLGRRSIASVSARVALPGFDNSAMDGYAVRAAEAVAGARLPVGGEQPAGRDLGIALGEGQAVRIFTGAPMPQGADAVVMQEDTEREGDSVVIVEAPEEGEFIRRRGSEVCEGQQLIRAGDLITAQRIGLLASQGIAELAVGGAPRVGVLSTGDELVEPGADLGPGEIYNSNRPMLAAMAARVAPGAMAVRGFHASDDLEVLRAVVAEALAESDVLVIAGGVSVGDRDLVKPVLETCGVEMDFWRVRMKPGKPFLFGRSGSGGLVFGLPGNPVSAFVTFEVFVAPALRRWMGAREDEVMPRPIPATLGAAAENPGDRPHYLRGFFDPGDGRFLPGQLQQSHALNGLARAEGLLRLEADERLETGAEVRVFPVA